MHKMIKLLITNSEKASTLFVNEMKASKRDTLGVLSSKSLVILEAKIKPACKGKTCFFIDTINEEEKENAIYIPQANLTALSIAINQAQQSFNGKSTIIFDSISGLAVRNDPKTLIKFFLFLIKKSSDWNADITFILSEKTMPEDFIAVLSSSVDKVERKK
jgi:archaellum biogenesis ATPase FlaH